MCKVALRLFLCYFLFETTPLHAQYVWRNRACPPTYQGGGTSFVLNNKAYVVGGDTLPPSSINICALVWEYDPATDTWTEKNNFPHSANNPACFVINDTAYVGLGLDSSLTYHTDFWRYDLANDQWIQLADFPGAPRYTAMSFVLNGLGYVGCGKGATEYNDFYAYNPGTNVWTQMTTFPGAVRQTGIGGAVGGKGYMGLGWGNGSFYSDMYQYNDTLNSWTPINSFTTTGRGSAGSFIINDTLYATGGYDATTFYRDCWFYNQSINTWVPQADYTCYTTDSIFIQDGFAINGHGFIRPLDGLTPLHQLLEFGPLDNSFMKAVNVLGNDTSYCAGFSRVLTTGSPCTAWSTGATGPQITVNAFGTYWAHFPYPCGVQGDTITITPDSTSLSFSYDTSYCGPFSRVLSTGIANTTWSTGATGAQITITTPGDFWASATNACGNINDTFVINELAAPQATLRGDSFLCTGQTVLLNATSANATYHWQDNSTTPTYEISSPGIYSVTVANASGCSLTESVDVMYSSPPPQVDLGSNIKICGDTGTTLNISIANAHFIWNDGSTDSFYHVIASGTYSVTVSNGCSSASSEVNVSIHPDDCRIFIPTAFSPNEDGVNDLFHAICHCPVSDFSMHVFDRWGEEVFSSNNIQKGWDGTYKTMNAPLAVYVYYIDYMNYCEGKTEQIKGNVTLVR